MKKFFLVILMGVLSGSLCAAELPGGITSKHETEAANQLFGKKEESPQRLRGNLTQPQRLESYLKRHVEVSLAIKAYLKRLSDNYINLDKHDFPEIPKALNTYKNEIDARILHLQNDLKKDASEIDEASHQRELVKTDIANNVLEIAKHIEFQRINPFKFDPNEAPKLRIEFAVKQLGKRKVQDTWIVVEYSNDDELLNGLIDTRNSMLGINLRDPENKGPSVEERVQSFLRMATAARYESPIPDPLPEEPSQEGR